MQTQDPAPAETLRTIASFPFETRRSVAGAIGTPPEVFADLAGDEIADVRIAVARNPSIPASVAKILASDADPAIRAAIARNPATDTATVQSLACDPAKIVRMEVAERTTTPRATLRMLTQSADWDVCAMAGATLDYLEMVDAVRYRASTDPDGSGH